MKPISKTVEEVVVKEPFILELMKDGLINLSSLARKIMPEVEKDRQIKVTHGSILMALIRINENLCKNTKTKLANQSIGFHDITVRTNLCDYTFENSPTLLKCQEKLLKHIAGKPDIFYSTSRGIYESTVLVSSTLSNQIEKVYGKEKMVAKADQLAAITVGLPNGSSSIVGLYYMIFREISWQGINIYEVISTTNEITLFVKESDVNKTFKILNS